MRVYQQHVEDIQAQGASLIAISPQSADNSLTIIEKNELKFEVLSDVGNNVARQFGLVFRLADELRTTMSASGIKLPEYNGDESWELPIPGTFIIGPDGTITLAYVDANHTTRLEPGDILDNLQST